MNIEKNMHTIQPNYKEYCQHFGVFFFCSSLVYSSVVECITGLFRRILCMRYLTSSTITVFSSRPHSLFIYSFFGISVPIATYCAQEHYWFSPSSSIVRQVYSFKSFRYFRYNDTHSTHR